MLNGRAADIKRHKWFDGLDWDALEARKMEPPRLPKDDSAKRLRELTVSASLLAHLPDTVHCRWPSLSSDLDAKPRTDPATRLSKLRVHLCTLCSFSSPHSVDGHASHCSDSAMDKRAPVLLLQVLQLQTPYATKFEAPHLHLLHDLLKIYPGLIIRAQCRTMRKSRRGNPRRLQRSYKTVKWSLRTSELRRNSPSDSKDLGTILRDWADVMCTQHTEIALMVLTHDRHLAKATVK